MDKKTHMILLLAKYGGYIAVLWIALSNHGAGMDGPILPLPVSLPRLPHGN